MGHHGRRRRGTGFAAILALIVFAGLSATPAWADEPEGNGGGAAADAAAGDNANTDLIDRDLGKDGDGLHTFTFPEEFVTASLWATPTFDLPYTAHSIDREPIGRRQYRTTPEILRDIPGTLIQKTAHGHGSPYIRGFTSFRNLFLIDGIRLNNSVFRPGPNQYWNTVDPFLIDRMEVVKGPTSVMYGSDGIGGTVNIFTRSPFTYGDGFNAGGRTVYRYSTAERSNVWRGEGSVSMDDHTGLLFGGTSRDFGNLRGGDDIGEMPQTGYDEWSGDLKIEHYLDPRRRLVASWQRMRQNNLPRTHKTIHSKRWHGTTVGNELQRDLDQERELVYLQFHGEDLQGDVDLFRTSLSYHRHAEERHRLRTRNREDLQGFDVHQLGFFTHVGGESPIGRLTGGLEYYHDNVNSFSDGNPIQGPVGDEASYDMVGLFLEDRIAFTDRFDVTLGGRFNWAHARAFSVMHPVTGRTISVDDDWGKLVGNARFRYGIVEDTVNLFGGVSQGFRAPNLSDLTRFDSARTNEFETPSPGLDPERYLSYELGVKTTTDTVTAQCAYFITTIDGQILRFPTGRRVGNQFEVTKANVGEGQVYGIELDAAWEFVPRWTLFGNATYMEGEVSNFRFAGSPIGDEYISRLMPLTGQLGVRWENEPRTVFVEALGRMANQADKLSFRDTFDDSRIPPGGTPGYAVLALRGGYEVVENLEVNLAVENVLDRDYRVHGSGQNEAGLNFIVGVDFTF
jgi:hemoglobin/transferrin/lactoferrin receptor protein